jgi:serine/threonine protein kinase
MVDKDFFIIIDRLWEILDQRMDKWRDQMKKHDKLSLFRPSNKTKKILEELRIERLTVAYDLAAALCYLHEHKLVYRDIKPANIGFDHRGTLRKQCTYGSLQIIEYILNASYLVLMPCGLNFSGDVKVFDFGLCKSLSPSLKALDGEYGYRLTVQAGSLPYMAPEVVLSKTYDSKCDVFSFAILLWEILSLQHCCKKYSPEKFIDRVSIHHERFPIRKSWPPFTRLMIPEAWDDDPKKRPDMKRVAMLIRGDLNNMSTDDSILHRTVHLRDRSSHQ